MTIEPTGWRSQVEIALVTCRRVLLHGSVMDKVLVPDAAGVRLVPLVQWLGEQIAAAGFERVIDYDHVGFPVAVRGELPPELTSLSELERQRCTENPSVALELLRRTLQNASSRTAVIVRNAEQVQSAPQRWSQLLYNLGRSGRSDSESRNLEIHLFTLEDSIPKFLKHDPETRRIFLSRPPYQERLECLRSLLTQRPLEITEKGAVVAPERWGRATEGFLLAEVEQLTQFAACVGRIELADLLRRFRFGRSYDYWSTNEIESVVERIGQKVLGQEDAIQQLRDHLYMAKHRVSELIEPGSRAPAMVLFFVGTTGIGKTMMARALCEEIIGTSASMKIFDMSEYQQDHSVQRLIGSPPSYVGYAEGGQLTQWVRQVPYSVVLIDEVEKAHDRILDVFLQVLDGARLTDGRGETVDFSETILIFTSNIGAENIESDLLGDPEAAAAYFRKEVEDYFREELGRPELFGRLSKGGIIAFNFIDERTARMGIKRMLTSLAEGVQKRLDEARSSAAGACMTFDEGDPETKRVIDEVLTVSKFSQYGLRIVSTELMKLAGGGVGKFLDARPPSGRYRFAWNDEHGKIEIGGF